MKKLYYSICLLLICSFFFEVKAMSEKKRVLYINSYHSGYLWSDGIEKAIKNKLGKSTISIDLKTFYMNTKNIQDIDYNIKMGKKAKSLVDTFKPDVVIISDDNALKYFYKPYFYKSSIPFVFCGINGSSSKYDLGENITGMEQVQLSKKMVDILKNYSKGERIGLLQDDSISTRGDLIFVEKELNKKIDARLVFTIEEWKKNFIELQDSVDILFLGTSGRIKELDSHKNQLKKFVKENIKIPIGTWENEIIHYSVLGLIDKPQEQGSWAASTAIRILKGEKIENISIVKNKEANIFINTTLAKKLNIVFPFDFIDYAELVE